MRKPNARPSRAPNPEHLLSGSVELLDSIFEGLAECFVANVIARRVVLCERHQCTGVALAVLKAGGSVVVGREDEEVLSGGHAAESELAQPSQLLARGRY